MRLLRKIEAVLCWLIALCSIVGIFLEKKIEEIPYGVFSVVIFTKWGFDLWKDDTRKIAINGCLMALLMVLVFWGELFACVFLGGFIVGVLAVILSGGDASYVPEIVNGLSPWVSVVLMIICLFKFPPSKVLPKRFFIDKSIVNTKSDENLDCKKEDLPAENTTPTLKEFEASDHSKYMPKFTGNISDEYTKEK